jgi:hypothetical protein
MSKRSIIRKFLWNVYEFPDIPSCVQEVKVFEELLNIPYSKSPCKYIPEIRKNSNNKDLNIFFIIHKSKKNIYGTYNVWISIISIYIPDIDFFEMTEYKGSVPIINSTTTSIMDIYRNYGLNMTISLLRQLVINAKEMPDRTAISMYFFCCFVAITGDKRSFHEKGYKYGNPIPLLVQLTDILIEIDNKIQIKLPYNLTPITQFLPNDILCLIINSIRINKSIAKIVTTKEKMLSNKLYCDIPTDYELIKSYKKTHSFTQYRDKICYCENIFEISVDLPYRIRPRISVNNEDESVIVGGDIVAYSYDLLYDVYWSRYRNAENKSIYAYAKTTEYLHNLANFIVTKENIIEACGIYIQLEIDIIKNRLQIRKDLYPTKEIISTNEELQKLIRKAARILIHEF